MNMAQLCKRILGMAARCLGALALLACGLFCAFGFMASFEPLSGPALPWQAGYAGLGCACFTAIGVLLVRPGRQILGAIALSAGAVFSVLGLVESSFATKGFAQLVCATFVVVSLIGAVALFSKGLRQRRVPLGTSSPRDLT
jgi:hypothetical protein